MPTLLNLSHQENVKLAANLSFAVDVDTLTCVNCCASIADRRRAIYCVCKSCVYCSQTCKLNDRDHWVGNLELETNSRCNKIVEISKDIRTRTQRLRRFNLGDDFTLFDDSGFNKPPILQ